MTLVDPSSDVTPKHMTHGVQTAQIYLERKNFIDKIAVVFFSVRMSIVCYLVLNNKQFCMIKLVQQKQYVASTLHNITITQFIHGNRELTLHLIKNYYLIRTHLTM